jgi:exopolysaccharide biosynthesis polyprenyl glycosylphosphotransferase
MSFSGIVLLISRPFLIAGPILGSLIFLVQDKTYSRSIFVGFLGIYFVLILLEKLCIKAVQNQVRLRGLNYRNILLVGVGEDAAHLGRLLERHAYLGMRVTGHVTLEGEPEARGIPGPVLGTVEDLPGILDRHVVDEVFFAVRAEDLPGLERHIWACEEVGVRVHLKVDFVSTLLSRTYASDVEGIPILTFSSTPHTAGAVVIKRSIDVALSLAGLLVLSPVFLLIALAIKLTSPGPVLYRQVRAGLNGRTFVLLKFRSMCRDAEAGRQTLAAFNEMTGPVFKMKHDPRVTSVGRFLRWFSLDELPQLWSVLKGDMSIVGPRPPLPEEVVAYRRWQRRRLSMKPGLTCLWQVNGRNQIDFEEWMKLDMAYIDNWSLSLDLKILARTVSAVLLARGAR